MSTLTLELPERFTRAERTTQNEYHTNTDKHQPKESILLDGDTFARQVIANNRELFEELARL